MSEPDERFLDISSSISDGDAPRWSEFESPAASQLEKGLLRELKIVNDIVGFHRAQQAADDRPTRWGTLDLIDKVGEGRFGEIFRAHDAALERDVALKLSWPEPEERQRRATSIVHEGRQLAKIRHPNVVTVFGVDQDAGRVGIWMEFIEGRTLQDIVKDAGPLGEQEAALVGLDLCRALAAVHQAGLVHRDVKAQNVMRETGGRIVLMDLGLGASVALRDEDLSGTPLYMAPELFGGAPTSTKGDIYALGVLLYFLVSGRYPIEAGSLNELKDTLRRGEFRRLREVRPDLSLEFVQTVERMLDPDPRRRCSGTGEIEDMLSGVAKPVADRPRAEKSSQRLPRRLFLIGVAATILLGVAAIVVTNALRDRASAYTLEAAFYKHDSAGNQRLFAGDGIGIGDQFYLDLVLSRALHVYVVNEDETGESWLLFPLPGHDLTNPLQAGRHRLPGTWQGQSFSWEISSAGGKEHLLLITSAEPLPQIESDLAALATPRIDSPPMGSPISGEAIRLLRGAGVVSKTPVSPQDRVPEQFHGLARPLREGSEEMEGVSIRELVLNNPAR